MTVGIVGRPKRSRPVDRVNYKLDTDLREMLQQIAERNGRNEGAQVEQLILFYEAIEQLNSEGVQIPFNEINARVRQIWAGLIEKDDRATSSDDEGK
ncbi:hypothetical protein NIES2135_34250 [Leptolyngbya boryana NIES-2135]|jgi:predicted transcriptional regulator|uniref:Uncharacterized protein n=1 Tax=Leptolyngbya boryana NIES-2135 TaxID=1973484 RepID=A0A1Z4JIL6_LEPBY|nr:MULTISPECIES: hypothetical protein [Leptolyngbya]BAY56591.1 hypothetical protein NIES2135_34250 [Leptolyngbya boryana NIES-2135]MBD2369893.1 hypothetical protein [Leptolyngbya sp. FACHB-161]MBD2376162.1 hypothetical protein [Leptolyngbya sp. FACHB-238]MBD2400437.1 hypothetical protein [Leptolyngbya sp. FACHB-239]MBD2406979.1 hypothetical protein [Leptolyngbya sp. FACHB-402]